MILKRRVTSSEVKYTIPSGQIIEIPDYFPQTDMLVQLGYAPSVRIVNDTIILSQSFDGLGAIYQHGPNLGDKLLFRLRGTGNTLQNVLFDDNWFAGGVNGVVSVEGDSNTLRKCGLINCERYGFLYWDAKNFKIVENDIKHAQHCISGATSGSQPLSYDGFIEHNTIAGMILEGIKLKHGQNIKARYNEIDVSATYPGYRGDPRTFSKQGIYFSHDGPNIDCLAEENHIYVSVPSSIPSYGILAENNEYGAAPLIPSTGNKIINNPIEKCKWGVYLRGDNYTVERNPMTDVTIRYTDLGKNNIIIE